MAEFVAHLKSHNNKPTFMLPLLLRLLAPLPPQSSQLSAAWALLKLRLRGGNAAAEAVETVMEEAGGSWYGLPSTSAFNFSR